MARAPAFEAGFVGLSLRAARALGEAPREKRLKGGVRDMVEADENVAYEESLLRGELSTARWFCWTTSGETFPNPAGLKLLARGESASCGSISPRGLPHSPEALLGVEWVVLGLLLFLL